MATVNEIKHQIDTRLTRARQDIENAVNPYAIREVVKMFLEAVDLMVYGQVRNVGNGQIMGSAPVADANGTRVEIFMPTAPPTPGPVASFPAAATFMPMMGSAPPALPPGMTPEMMRMREQAEAVLAQLAAMQAAASVPGVAPQPAYVQPMVPQVVAPPPGVYGSPETQKVEIFAPGQTPTGIEAGKLLPITVLAPAVPMPTPTASAVTAPNLPPPGAPNP